jgi:nucleoside-diphosphate-sugar epimerase
MHFEVVYATGLSGFVGKNLLPLLLDFFPEVINFRRNNICEIFSSDGNVKILDVKYLKPSNDKKLFINIAAKYNSIPRSEEELLDLYISNTSFPVELIENYIGSKNLKIIQLASYFQLLDLQFQTPYSLSKSLGMKYMEQNYSDVSIVYLFDTFGTNDTRNKVIDTYINKIIDKRPIRLPKKDLYINISHVSEVCNSIMNCIDLPSSNYCIMSENTLSLKFIATQIMKLVGNTVEIESFENNVDYFSHIEKSKLPKNIFLPLGTQNFIGHLKSRISEIESFRLR